MAVRIPDILKQFSESDDYKLLRAKDINVTEAAALGSLANADIFIVDDNAQGTQASTKKITAEDMKSYFNPGGGNADTVTLTDNGGTGEENFITFGAGATGTGDVGLETDAGLKYNPSTNVLTATGGFAGTATLAGSGQTFTQAITFSGEIQANGGMEIPAGENLETDSIISTTAGTNLSISSKDNVGITLDSDDTGSGHTFNVIHGGGGTVFSVNTGGDAVVGNDLEVNGELTVQSFADGADAIINLFSDKGDDANDKWRLRAVNGGDFTVETYAADDSWTAALTIANSGTITGTFSSSTVDTTGINDSNAYYPVFVDTASSDTGQTLYTESVTTSTVHDFKYQDHTLYVQNMNVEGTLTAPSVTASTASFADEIKLSDWGVLDDTFYIPFMATRIAANASESTATTTDGAFNWTPSTQVLMVGGTVDGDGTSTIRPMGSESNNSGSNITIDSGAGHGTSSGTDGNVELATGGNIKLTVDGASGLVTIANNLTVSGSATIGDSVSDTLTVAGNLIVNGTTTNVNTTNLNIEDVAINLGTSMDGSNATWGSGDNNTAICFSGSDNTGAGNALNPYAANLKLICDYDGVVAGTGVTYAQLKVMHGSDNTYASNNNADDGITSASIKASGFQLDSAWGTSWITGDNFTTATTDGMLAWNGTDLYIYDHS